MILKEIIIAYKNRKFYAQFIGKGDLCFDIGANVGKKSKLFLSLGAKVIAFEPQSVCLEKLQKIKAEHAEFDFHPLAIGSKDEEKELFLANHMEVATLSEAFVKFYTTAEIYWNTKETVIVNTLDSVIEKIGIPHFCKIDTEGYELNILSSLSHKIPIIEFEFTEGFFENTLKVVDLLTTKTAEFNLVLNENLKFISKEWVSGSQLKTVLLSLPQSRLHGNIFVKTHANK